MDVINPNADFTGQINDLRHNQCIRSWRGSNNEEDDVGMSDPIDVFNYFPNNNPALGYKLIATFNCNCGHGPVTDQEHTKILNLVDADRWIANIDDSFWSEAHQKELPCGCENIRQVSFKPETFPAYMIFENAQRPFGLDDDEKADLGIASDDDFKLTINEEIDICGTQYECVAVIWFGAGHYTVDIKDAIINVNSDNCKHLEGWYHYDGLLVSEDYESSAYIYPCNQSPCNREINLSNLDLRNAWPKVYVFKKLS
jgi:hypothetical protein